MSFKIDSSAVSIANRALAMIGESKTISSLDDVGFNATAVSRWYKPVVARLLEMHHWGLATKRSSLASAVNTRATEWSNAYVAPVDMAFPVSVSLNNGASSVSYYQGLGGLIALAYGQKIFQHHNGIIYSNLTGELEYVSFDITEANFTATFENIVVLMLASRLALELPKDMDLSDNLAQKALTEINMAMAQNLNAGNQRYGMQVSEGELARGTGYGSNWDYIPLSPGA